MNDGVILKPGREKAIKNRHHWIFSGAVQRMPDFENGSILPVYSARQELLGHACFNKATSIAGRMISFGDIPPLDALKRNVASAVEFRRRWFDDRDTNAFRLVNGEGDMLPGLIADKYGTVVVVQISTLGMEKLKPVITGVLRELVNPSCIYEKSDASVRAEEGLGKSEGILFGELPEEIVIQENELSFFIDVVHGQKTGFFLDQREMRKLSGTLSGGRRVLDCFSYSGGFSVYAAHGGAVSVDSVDSSAQAIELARRNCQLNHSQAEHNFHTGDVFTFLRGRNLQYDFVILDPPAFAKKKGDVIRACWGYKDINRIAMAHMPQDSLLLTCSCSYHIDESLFQKVIFEAAVEANRTVRIIQKHRHAYDHPVNICHPEGNYLKSLLLAVE